MAAAVDGDVAGCGAFAREALELFGDDWWRDPYGRFGWNMLGREIALAERWDDADAEVQSARLSLSREPQRRVALEASGALGTALAGRPLDALRRVAEVRNVTGSEARTIMRVELATAEAIARRELGDRAQSARQLAAIVESPAETMLFCKILALSEMANGFLDDDNEDEATRTFDEVEKLVESESFGQLGRDCVARVGCRLALARGDRDDALPLVAEDFRFLLESHLGRPARTGGR